MIPKKIHYIWVGGNPKPEIVLKCIESWKKYLPDYEIIEWNESNYDINKNAYIKEAYESRKWAFVSDYMRFDILYTYGGLYFDTDVEMLKAFPGDILGRDSFTGMESAGRVAPGLIFACQPRNWLVGEMLASYKNDHFDVNHIITVNMRMTEILVNNGFVQNGEFQVIKGFAIYPAKYFCGYDQDIREYDIQEETISVHHYAGTWKSSGLKGKLRIVVKSILGKNNYRKLLKLKRKFIGINDN